ncbi:MAG: tetratricopeptide repeat protein [Bacteroidetes bacterium]|nr:tetratricopeptide repeat protein [Bacteroidota bacterium]
MVYRDRNLFLFILIFAQIFVFENIVIAKNQTDSLLVELKNAKEIDKAKLLNEISENVISENLDEAGNFAHQALEYATKYKIEDQEAHAHYNIAEALFYKNEYDSSVVYYENSLRLYIKQNKRRDIFASINSIAYISDLLGDFEKSLKLYKQVLDSAIIHHDSDYISTNYNNIGDVYYNSGNLFLSLEYYNKALEIQNEINDKTEISRIFINIGITNNDLGNYKDALEYYQKAMFIEEELGNRKGISLCLNNIGIIYSNLGNNEKALETYKESIKIEKSLGNEFGIGSSLNNIGIVFVDLMMYDSALVYYEKSLEIEKHNNDRKGIATSINNIGELYFEMGKPKESIEFLLKGLEIEEELNNIAGITNSYNSIGDIYFKLGQYEIAYEYFEKCKQLADSLNFVETKFANLEDLYLINKRLRNYKEALNYYTQYIELKDSIMDENVQNQVAEMERKYESVKNEKEIEILKIEKQLHKIELEKQQVEIEKQNTYFVISIVVFSVFVLLLIILFRQFYVKRRALELLRKKNYEIVTHQKELRIAKEKAEESDRLKSAFLANMSHELRTPLNAIIGFSFVIEQENVSPEVNDFAIEINKSGNNLLELIEDIFELSLIETGEMVTKKEEILVSEFFDEMLQLVNSEREKLGKNEIETKYKLSFKIKEIFFDRNVLTHIFKQILKNAIKFTEKGHVEFGLNIGDGNSVLFYITDTGIGISEEKQEIVFENFRQIDDSHTRKYEGTGLGLFISKKLLAYFGGQIWLESEEGKGSTFYFVIPDIL